MSPHTEKLNTYPPHQALPKFTFTPARPLCFDGVLRQHTLASPVSGKQVNMRRAVFKSFLLSVLLACIVPVMAESGGFFKNVPLAHHVEPRKGNTLHARGLHRHLLQIRKRGHSTDQDTAATDDNSGHGQEPFHSGFTVQTAYHSPNISVVMNLINNKTNMANVMRGYRQEWITACTNALDSLSQSSGEHNWFGWYHFKRDTQTKDQVDDAVIVLDVACAKTDKYDPSGKNPGEMLNDVTDTAIKSLHWTKTRATACAKSLMKKLSETDKTKDAGVGPTTPSTSSPNGSAMGDKDASVGKDHPSKSTKKAAEQDKDEDENSSKGGKEKSLARADE